VSSDPTVATVSRDLTFRPNNWNTPQTVIVTGVEDGIVNAPLRTATISHTVSGGGDDYDGITVDTIRVTATDDDTPGVTVSPEMLTIAEGRTEVYTVVLDKQPSDTVIVTPSSNALTVATFSPPSLTFTPADWNTPQDVTVTSVDDAKVNNPARTATISHGISGGGYDGITVSPVQVNATDNDATGVTVSRTALSIPEAGGMDTYTVVLNTLPTADVTVTLTAREGTVATFSPTPLTFTPANWNVEQTVTVTVAGVDDAIANDPVRTVVIGHQVTSTDGDYNGAEVTDMTVTATDDDTAGITVTPLRFSLTEGGDRTYRIVLDSQPTADVTVTPSSSDDSLATVPSTPLTFTPTNWNVAQEIIVTAVDNQIVDGPIPRQALIANRFASDDPAYGGHEIATVAIVGDDDTAGVTVSVETLGVPEARGIRLYTVMLNTQPTSDVTITPTSSDETVATVSNPLTFTATNWNQPQPITVTGVPDIIDNNPDRTATISHEIIGGGYDQIPVASVTVTATDDDRARVTLSRTELTFSEDGGTGTYQVVLTTEPTGDVTIRPVADPAVARVSSPLTFSPSNWQTPQTVTVTGVPDTIANDPTRTTTVTHTVSGGGYDNVTVPSVRVTAIDNEGAGVTLSAVRVRVPEANGTGTYTIVLNTQPLNDVTVTPVSRDETVVKVSDALVFTTANWNIEQNVTVTGMDDAIASDPPRTVHIDHQVASSDPAYSDVTVAEMTATATDDDTARVTVSTRHLSFAEGETRSYTIILTSQPTGDVTVTPVSSNEGVVTFSAAPVFTPANWNVAQTVIVTGVDDAVDNYPARSTTIAHEAVGGGYDRADVSQATLAVTVANNDGAGVKVTPLRFSFDESEAGTYEVALNTEPTHDVTITIEGNDDRVATVSPSQLTFTPDNWDVPQTVTVTGVDDLIDNGPASKDVLITNTTVSRDPAYNRQAIATVATVRDDDPAGVTLSAIALRVAEGGGTGTYTVVLNSQPTNGVTVTPRVRDGRVATVSGPVIFNRSNWNQPQVVTVTGVEDSAINDPPRTTTVTHQVSGGGYAGVPVAEVTVTATDNEGAGVTLSKDALNINEAGETDTYTVALKTAPLAPVTVALTNSTPAVATVSPPQLVFDATNWNVEQTVTVTVADDTAINTPDRRAIIRHQATSADGAYQQVGIPDVTVTALDDDWAQVRLSREQLWVPEAGGTRTYQVQLVGQPRGDATVTPVVSNQRVATVSGALTFTPSNWNEPQIVTVTGVNDDLDSEGDRTTTVSHRIGAEGYEGVSAATMTVMVTDDEGAEVVLSTEELTVDESGDGTYTVQLNTQPSQDVTVTPSSSDLGMATFSPPSLTFTASNWNQPQIVTVTGIDDDRVNDPTPRQVLITHTAASSDNAYDGRRAFLNVAIRDDDGAPIGPAVILSTTRVRVAETYGTQLYTIVLNTPPTDVVTVTPRSSDARVVTVSGPVRFTASNWSIPQSILVVAVDDLIDNDPDQRAIISHTMASNDADYNGRAVASVIATAIDDDVAGVTFHGSGLNDAQIETLPAFNLAEGGIVRYGLLLRSQPTGNVRIRFVVGDGTVLTVEPPELTFTASNWNQPQIVTITGVNDDIDNEGRTTTITLMLSGGGYDGAPINDIGILSSDEVKHFNVFDLV